MSLVSPWQDRKADVGHTQGARDPGSVCPAQELLLPLLAGGTRRWHCSLSSAGGRDSAAAIPQHQNQHIFSKCLSQKEVLHLLTFLSKYHKWWFPGNKENQNAKLSLGQAGSVGHWQAGVAILCHLRGLGSSLCRDPSSPSWPQADCKEPSKGSSLVLDPEHQGKPFPFAVPFPSPTNASAVTSSRSARTRSTPRCKPPSAKQICWSFSWINLFKWNYAGPICALQEDKKPSVTSDSLNLQISAIVCFKRYLLTSTYWP